jgi:hypothetical protein
MIRSIAWCFRADIGDERWNFEGSGFDEALTAGQAAMQAKGHKLYLLLDWTTRYGAQRLVSLVHKYVLIDLPRRLAADLAGGSQCWRPLNLIKN